MFKLMGICDSVLFSLFLRGLSCDKMTFCTLDDNKYLEHQGVLYTEEAFQTDAKWPPLGGSSMILDPSACKTVLLNRVCHK